MFFVISVTNRQRWSFYFSPRPSHLRFHRRLHHYSPQTASTPIDAFCLPSPSPWLCFVPFPSDLSSSERFLLPNYSVTKFKVRVPSLRPAYFCALIIHTNRSSSELPSVSFRPVLFLSDSTLKVLHFRLTRYCSVPGPILFVSTNYQC